VGLSIFAALQIRFSHDVLKWFPEKNEIRQATEKIDYELRGTLNLEVIIDAGNENELYNPPLLKRIDKAAADTESLELEDVFVGKAWSLSTILKEINQALNENRSDYYTIPSNRDLIAQEFLLFENSGSDDLEDVVDSQFSKARFTVKGPFKDAVKYNRFIDTVNRYFDENFPEETIYRSDGPDVAHRKQCRRQYGP
jgi:predicted RND superfamily exporter protein